MDAQRRKGKKADAQSALSSSKKKEDNINLSGLKFRNITPGFFSGRISDIAIHPENENVWYATAGSGGVWKTMNAGTTWKPIFDKQSSYSIGCISIDPSNTHTVWAGTGENVGGRHVGFGDGIYRSDDDGKSWRNLGLEKSEHISKIIVHPDNSDVVFVAVQGPLWSKGGERGFYKTTDGGATWNQTLGNNEWTGVTDILIDPRNPDVLYAATWDRHRTVAAYMGGGPGSGIHRSLDGGETWEKLSSGIPNSNLGKIGLALNPFNPDMIYAAIELDRKKGGIFMSANMGKSWTKQSNVVSGGTGPHYYQELYASPHHEGKLYLMDVRVKISEDHGKSFYTMQENDKHSDNHAIAFKASDPDYLLVGTDAGIYQSFDDAENWSFFTNLPLTQYYKVAVDDAKPFYWVYGGTQDNGSHGGPSQTDTRHNIRDADWIKTLGADGHQSATEPGNPNIIYAETQKGGLNRIDRLTGEQTPIQPQASPGEPHERFNWDAPIVVSPHQPTRLYFASYRVWKSEDRGDSWTAISGDLTRNEERISLPIMGRQQSWDNAWDVNAMSDYNTIASLAESSLKAGLLYAGTDDGIFQMSEDDGGTWTRKELGSISGMPATGFVNNLYADLHDVNTVYMAADNHKYGDFKPYLYKSTDQGVTWTSISSNLPERLLVWRVVQDHVDPNLLFAATEFGIYFTNNGGGEWTKLNNGLPTISFRDITIQRREEDLVAASFGRGFYILDDYSALRSLDQKTLAKEAHLFPVKDALIFSPKSIEGGQGVASYAGQNPAQGASFTYYVKDNFETLQSQRKKAEKKLNKEGKDVPFPGWDALEKEGQEEPAMLVFTIKDKAGDIVNILEQKPRKGVNRMNWNMRHMSKNGISIPQGGQSRGGFGRRRGGGGFPAQPGEYSVSMSKKVDGQLIDLGEKASFSIAPLRKPALQGMATEDVIAFKKDFEAFQQDVTASSTTLRAAGNKLRALKTASTRVDRDLASLSKMIYEANLQYQALDKKLNGDKIKAEIGEKYAASPRSSMFAGYRALSSSYGPTKSQIATVNGAKGQLNSIKYEIIEFQKQLEKIQQALISAGSPWIEGQELKVSSKS